MTTTNDTNDRVSSTVHVTKVLVKPPVSDPRVGATSTGQMKDPYARKQKAKKR